MTTSSYFNPFGSNPIQPSQVSERGITLSANLALQWPFTYVDTPNVAPLILEVSATSGGLTLKLPPANQASNGQSVMVNNVSGTDFFLQDAAGGAVATVSGGSVQFSYVRDNTTSAGLWRTLTFGTGTTAAQATALAGNGLTVSSGLLNTAYPVVSKAADYTVVTADRATLLKSTGGTIQFTLPSAATAGDNFWLAFANQGTGTLTISGTNNIDGAASLALAQTETTFLVSDGTNWFTVGRGRQVSSSVGRLVKSVAGNVDVTLTGTEAANLLQEYTGALTGNISVIVPTATAVYDLFNNTTGSQSLTIKTAAGTGIVLAQGFRAIMYCDGTNVVATTPQVVGSARLTQRILADSDVLFPLSGTLATLSGVETFENKTLSGATLTFTTNNAGTISGGTISGASIVASSFSGVTITNAVLAGTTRNTGTFSGGTISSASIVFSTFSGGTVLNSTISGGTVSGAIVASKAQMEGETGNVIVTPPNVKSSPGVAKAWVNFLGSSPWVIRDQYNIASVSAVGTGDYVLTFSTPFNAALYSWAGNAITDGGGNCGTIGDAAGPALTFSGGQFHFGTRRTDTGALTNFTYVTIAFYGDQ